MHTDSLIRRCSIMALRGKHRHLTLHHERHLLNDTSPALQPGESRFFSYRLPSLPAGEYRIAINQHVTAPNRGPPGDAEPARKTFEVVAPEWALSASADGGQTQAQAMATMTRLWFSPCYRPGRVSAAVPKPASYSSSRCAAAVGSTGQ